MYLFKPALGAALLLSLDLAHARSGRQPFDWLDIASQFAEEYIRSPPSSRVDDR
jgi:hypothetical protein